MVSCSYLWTGVFGAFWNSSRALCLGRRAFSLDTGASWVMSKISSTVWMLLCSHWDSVYNLKNVIDCCDVLLLAASNYNYRGLLCYFTDLHCYFSTTLELFITAPDPSTRQGPPLSSPGPPERLGSTLQSCMVGGPPLKPARTEGVLCQNRST